MPFGRMGAEVGAALPHVAAMANESSLSGSIPHPDEFPTVEEVQARMREHDVGPSQASPSRPTHSQQSTMMRRVGDPSEDYTHLVARDSMDVQMQAGEEAEVTQEVAVAISRFRRIAKERAAEAEHAAMEVDTKAEHTAGHAVEVVAMEEAEAEHTTAPAAEFELIKEVHVVHDHEPAIDFGLDVVDMYAEEPDREDMSLNTLRVEDMMAEKLVEFSEQLKEEEAEKAVVGVESSTPRQKKRKRKLKMTTLLDTSLTQSRTPSLQILSTPPKSPSPPPSPKTTTDIPTPLPTHTPTPFPQPIPIFTTATTTTVTTPTILIAAIRDFHFTAGTSSAGPSGLVDEVASLRAEMSLMQDRMNRLEAENRVTRHLAKFHAAEFRGLLDDVRGMHAEEIHTLTTSHQIT